MKRMLGALVLAAALMSATSVRADDDTYVAAAYSKTNGVVGFFVGVGEQATQDAAMAECKGSGVDDCQLALSGTNMCISLARATNKNAFGLGKGATRAESQSVALSECAENNSEGCNVHDTYCAPESLK